MWYNGNKWGVRMDKQEIALLATKAAQGDADAFNELYLQTRDAAYFVALSITKNEDDAADMVQEAYLTAWQKLATLDKPESFSSWFNQITANAARMFLRKRKPLLFTEEEDAFDWEPEHDDEYVPHKNMDTAETKRLIMAIVDELPEDQRLCVMLHYFDEMPVAEIASSIEVSVNTVTSRLFYARKKISTGVQALEQKHGLRLYAAAPMPLFIWALKQMAAGSAANLPSAVLGGTAAAAGGAAAASAGTAGTSTAAAGAAKGTAVAMPKIIASITAGAVVVGGTVAAIALVRRPKPEPVGQPVAVTSTVVASKKETLNETDTIHVMPKYSQNDVAAVNKIIQDNGLNWTLAPADGSFIPDDWTDVIYWTNDAVGKQITALNIGGRSLMGTLEISALPALESLICGDNAITALHISNLPSLTWLEFSNTQVKELRAVGVSSLISLYCYETLLTEIDLPAVPKLRSLGCGDNPNLTRLSKPMLLSVELLDCSSCPLLQLDVSGLTRLEELRCSGNQITQLSLSGCIALASLDCYDNNLRELDVSSLKALDWFDCKNNQLTSLDLSNNPELGFFVCNDNELTSLDLSRNPKLYGLEFSNNQLSQIDVSNNHKLEFISCGGNLFTDETGIIGLESLRSKNTAKRDDLVPDPQVVF